MSDRQPFRCPVCEGSGKLDIIRGDGTAEEAIDCSACNATGVIWWPVDGR